jgi:hypothetical protein
MTKKPKTYFLHVFDDGREYRFAEDPALAKPRKTWVPVLRVEAMDDGVHERTFVKKAEGVAVKPRGERWEFEADHGEFTTWKRVRKRARR